MKIVFKHTQPVRTIFAILCVLCVQFGTQPLFSQSDIKTPSINSQIEAFKNSDTKGKKEKAGKIKAFISDTIPTYTEAFGAYLKEVLEYQNRLDYLDGVKPNPGGKPNAQTARRVLELNYYQTIKKANEKDWTGLDYLPFNESNRSKEISKEVYGFHCYWQGNKYEKYDWNALSRVGYVGYDINPGNGSPISTHNWRNTSLHKRAMQYDVDVDIVASIRGTNNTNTFLNRKESWKTFADSLVQLLNYSQGDGVVLDFPDVNKQTATAFVEFTRLVKYILNENSPRFEVGIALPPVDVNKGFSIKDLKGIADRFIIFAFDYNDFQGVFCAPNAPMLSPNSDAYSMDRSYNFYVAQGMLPETITMVLGMYGQQWVMDQPNPINAKAIFGRTFSIFDFEEDMLVRFKPNYDDKAFQYYSTYSMGGKWMVNWGENIYSISIKSDYINNKKIGGIGFWDLAQTVSGNETLTKFWPLVYKKFSKQDAKLPDQIVSQFNGIGNYNMDSIIASNDALIMSAIDLAENPFLPEQIDTKLLSKAQKNGFQYKELAKAIGLLFTILCVCAAIALVFAMFDEKAREVVLHEHGPILFAPIAMILVVITLRVTKVILNSEMEFLIGALCGIGSYYVIQYFKNRQIQNNEETP